MTTMNFSAYSNSADNPLRAEQLRIASTIDADDIQVGDHIAHQPPGHHGFRRGTWTAIYKGDTYKFYTSVPHNADLDRQYEMVKHSAALHIAGLQSGLHSQAAGITLPTPRRFLAGERCRARSLATVPPTLRGERQ